MSSVVVANRILGVILLCAVLALPRYDGTMYVRRHYVCGSRTCNYALEGNQGLDLRSFDDVGSASCRDVQITAVRGDQPKLREFGMVGGVLYSESGKVFCGPQPGGEHALQPCFLGNSFDSL